MPDVIDANELLIPRFARFSDYAGVWCIEPNAGNALLRLAKQTDLQRHVAEAIAPTMRAPGDYETAKVAGPGGQQRQVAIIPIVGTLMKSVGSMSAGTSTVAARRQIRKAVADPDVHGIILAIDSPGGTVSGTADLANDVAAAAKQKPVHAFIEDLGASAAYWVASQASKVFANNETALVGSIGTLVVVYDYSQAAEKEGIKALVFGTGPLKGAGVPGSVVNPEQQAYFRDLVANSQQSFDTGVMQGRRLSVAKLAAAKTGGVFSAREALAKGLIDGIQSFDATLGGLARTVATPAGRTADASVPLSIVTEPPKQQLAPIPTQVAACGRFSIASDFVSDVGPCSANWHGGLVRSRFLPGCFSDWFARASRGEVEIQLLVDHDPRQVLASTRDASLLVEFSETHVAWITNRSTQRGIDAAKVAKGIGWFACSPGMEVVELGTLEYAPLGTTLIPGMSFAQQTNVWQVKRANMFEISLVPEGSIPGATASFI